MLLEASLGLPFATVEVSHANGEPSPKTFQELASKLIPGVVVVRMRLPWVGWLAISHF